MKFKVIVSEGIVGIEKTKLNDSCTTYSIGIFQKPIEVARLHPEVNGMLVLLSHRIDRRVMELLPELRVISNYAVGYDNIDVEEATQRGILVTNTPDVLTEATADLAWSLLLCAARRILEADRFVRSGRFNGWMPDLFLGLDLAAKTFGVVGMGRIGGAVARRANGFGMKVVYCDVRQREDIENELGAKRVDLERLLRISDVVSLHVPLVNDTRQLIGRKELSIMKKDAILINTSRGQVIDEVALYQTLKEKRIRAAGLDVFQNEPEVNPALFELDNVVLTPHIGSAGQETRERMAQIAVSNLIDALEGRMPQHPVNRPVKGW
ncbi:MAG: 2-hydroxyacid dehydrogenase [Candidatus Glassbacteria bacterium]